MTGWRLATVLLCVLASTSCDRAVSKMAPQTNGIATNATPGTGASRALPTPKTRVSMQTKYVHEMKSRYVVYETVDQWVFQVDGDDDGTLVCVGDGAHCISLVKLREQLSKK